MKERIEQILEDKRITQAEFASRVGISPATITHFFNGRNNLSDPVISKILQAYEEINPLWLLHGEGEKYKKTGEKLPLFSQEQSVREKQTFEAAQTREQNRNNLPDNKGNRVGTNHAISSPESNIAPVSPAVPPIAQSAGSQKQIRKIVFFYADKTFEEYYPG